MTQSIKFGFPPKLVTGADTDTISACGIKDGEQLIVDRNTTLGASVELTKPHTVPASKSIPATSIPVNGGILVVREMKDDNSCLFRSIGYLLENNPEISSKLRNVVSSKILADPIHYNAAILGKDPSVYASWILKPNSWGGGIELAILSEHYKVEIDLIDVATTRMSRLGENQYESRIFVMYTGIHYDAISWTPAENAPHDFEQRLFKNQEADDIARGAIKLAEIWKTVLKLGFNIVNDTDIFCNKLTVLFSNENLPIWSISLSSAAFAYCLWLARKMHEHMPVPLAILHFRNTNCIS
ncbi:ubiquitin-specific protease otu1 [Batrachochytrium dendrobatidis]|uniref:Ubiquitin thioesterase OTU n=1 Tax=Batrachochytrium dendrobatidis (strain JEL423) TaxID=403673 RepID=A0A177WH60_BATDL|nr:ubiquitin-specific protease otu1 [Batrachochytrium dendrobatidis]OAJ39447.1 hypothetical protein BDEG_23293 [Batrachochytrium dendrobatidis JEL423]